MFQFKTLQELIAWQTLLILLSLFTSCKKYVTNRLNFYSRMEKSFGSTKEKKVTIKA